jgi:GNAT superfamily N-acetyltransferase
MKAYRIRSAQPSEAVMLSGLALRSKAVWDYSPQFIAACRSALTVSAQLVSAAPVFLLEVGETAVGFYALEDWNGLADLAFFFIEPGFIRQGWGRILWEHAVRTARQMGYSTLRIESDPNAESFYIKMGAWRTGEVPSTVMAGRRLPLLQYDLRGQSSPVQVGECGCEDRSA